jgi:hypothetical protein
MHEHAQGGLFMKNSLYHALTAFYNCIVLLDHSAKDQNFSSHAYVHTYRH